MDEVKLPELGEGITTATVALWHCRPGDVVAKDDDLVDVVTDKAAFTISAHRDAAVKSLCVSEGSDVDVGATLAILEG